MSLLATAAALDDGAGDGVGGTTTGVGGCSATLAMPLPVVGAAGVPAAEGVAKLRLAGLLSTPSVLTSRPSRRTTVPSARRACSKSRSVRETRRCRVWRGSLEATGWRRAALAGCWGVRSGGGAWCCLEKRDARMMMVGVRVQGATLIELHILINSHLSQ